MQTMVSGGSSGGSGSTGVTQAMTVASTEFAGEQSDYLTQTSSQWDYPSRSCCTEVRKSDYTELYRRRTKQKDLHRYHESFLCRQKVFPGRSPGLL